MTLLHVEELKQHVETDLSDEAIQRLLDDAEREIINRHGVHGDPDSRVTDSRWGIGMRRIFLSRPAILIFEVKEREGTTETTLAANDYRSLMGGRALERLDNGTNMRSAWAPEVRVTYESSEIAERKRIQLDLVRLALAYNALISESAGNYSASSVDYEEEREKILSRLLRGTAIFA